MTETNKQHDWEEIEKDWRANVLSQAQMSAKHGISRTSIKKYFDRRNITRDLGKKIEFARNSKVAGNVGAGRGAAEKALKENEIVELNATMQADLILSHRKDIQKHRTLASKMLAEIEAVTENQDLFERLGDILIDENTGDKSADAQSSKLRAALNRAIDMPVRVDSFKKLTDTLKTIVALEREAFGIKDAVQENSVDDFINSMVD